MIIGLKWLRWTGWLSGCFFRQLSILWLRGTPKDGGDATEVIREFGWFHWRPGLCSFLEHFGTCICIGRQKIVGRLFNGVKIVSGLICCLPGSSIRWWSERTILCRIWEMGHDRIGRRSYERHWVADIVSRCWRVLKNRLIKVSKKMSQGCNDSWTVLRRVLHFWPDWASQEIGR